MWGEPPQNATERSEASEVEASHVESDLEGVAVLDFVVLALDPELPDLLRLVPRTELEQLVPSDHFGVAADLAIGQSRGPE